jgi:hypothetical protein
MLFIIISQRFIHHNASALKLLFMDLNLNFGIFHGILLRIHYSTTRFHAKFNDFREKFLNLPSLSLSLPRKLKPFLIFLLERSALPSLATEEKNRALMWKTKENGKIMVMKLYGMAALVLGFFRGRFCHPQQRGMMETLRFLPIISAKTRSKWEGGGFSDGI